MRQFLFAVFLLSAGNALAQTGVMTKVAGTGTAGFSGDGGPAASAQLNAPYNVVVDSSGNLYIADSVNNRIRKVNISTGVITTVAGAGSADASGDGGRATAAGLNRPTDAAVDSSGNLYIADSLNNKIRKVSTSGIITTVAGTGVPAYNGEGSATSADLNDPVGVAIDSSGNIYIADQGSHRIRKVTVSTGQISTFAGTGVGGFSGDGGPATSAQIYNPAHLTFDSSGSLFFADYFNHRIRKISASSGIITTVAGAGLSADDQNPGDFSGDGGPATSARLNRPGGVAVDASGNVFIADTLNKRIRMVRAATGVITTVAGGGTNGDGCSAITSSLDFPLGVAVNAAGSRVYIADYGANLIRMIASPQPVTPSLTSLAPSSGMLGTTRTVTLTGTGLSSGSASGGCQAGVTSVTVGGSGVAAGNVTVNSQTSVNVTLTIGPDAGLGPHDVTVTTENGTSNAVQFTVSPVPIPVPALNSITPSSGLRGSVVNVTLSGTDFGTAPGATSVTAGGTAITVTNVKVVTANALTATFAIAGGASLGSYQVSVITAGGSSNSVTFGVNPPGPAITYGLPPSLNPTQQAPIQLGLASVSPDPVTGQLTFTFNPNASTPADDPSVMFINGQTATRTVSFTFPPNSTTAQFSLPSGVLRAGTVAGTIHLSMNGVQVGGQSVTPATSAFDVTVPRMPPIITSVRVLNRSSAGFDVEITGYSTTRDITLATFQFAASGGNLQTTQLQPPVSSPFVTYYESPASQTAGSSFVYLQPFSAQQGDANIVTSVTVTLSNSAGASQPKTAP